MTSDRARSPIIVISTGFIVLMLNRSNSLRGQEIGKQEAGRLLGRPLVETLERRRGVDTGTDQTATDVPAGAQRLADVGAVVRIDIDAAIDVVGAGEVDQAAAELEVIRSGRILDADSGGKL